MTRIAIFGGTFDPPHIGHLLVAERAREQLALERVIFVPSHISPHKQEQRVGSAQDRVRMTKRALRGSDRFELSTYEISRKQVSYTVDTLEHFHKKHPNAQLYFLLGEDNLAGFKSWREPGRILQLAKLAVYHRGKPIDKRLCRGILHRIEWIDGASIPVSSSDIRQRCSLGRSIRFLVPEPVRTYIVHTALYRPSR